jgi:hypothetical protein
MKIEEARLHLEKFNVSELAQMTVKEYLNTVLIKELTTGTSNIALPTAVLARAVLQMKNWIDPRPYCVMAAVPKGAGKTATVQHLTQPNYGTWTEGSALTAADPTVASASITMADYGKVTQITDLLANTSLLNFVELVGKIHGGCIGQAQYALVVSALSACTTNVINLGDAGDAAEPNYAFTAIASGMTSIMNNGFHPDHVYTSPEKMWNCFNTNYAITQFYGALADVLANGATPKVFGLDWLASPEYELMVQSNIAFSGLNNEKYAIVASSEGACGFAELKPDPDVELYRVPTERANYVVTGKSMGVARITDNAVCLIRHAT